MLHLRIVTFFTVIGLIRCANIKWGDEIETGQWTTKHRISFPLTIEGKNYFFGLTDLTGGKYWFIQGLGENGKTAPETDTGTWDKYYTKVFPFFIYNKHYIYGIDDGNYWFIREILPGGKMGPETASGYWKAQPTVIFPYDVGTKHYVFSLTYGDWFITELMPDGKMGSETDSGTWNNYYTLGFPFSINGRTYFYCLSDNYWFTQELLSGGRMGYEVENGHWTTIHKLYYPFSIDDQYYFYGLTETDGNRDWFIQELLPGGKMGMEKSHGTWDNDKEVVFSYNAKGKQFFYLLSEYSWSIHEVVQEPRFPFVTTTREEYCGNNVVRTKRQDNNGTCDPNGCRGLNAVEESATDVENDDTNYDTMTFNNPAHPLMSVSTFRVFADSNHATYIDLTAAMRAEIHYSHMNPVRDPTISSEVREHLRQMDREGDDEAGHLLASSLGGAGVPFNFAPQNPTVNRAVSVAGSVLPQPGWYDVEELLRDYLIEMNGSGYVRWTLVVQYGLLPNSRRPTSFLLSIRFYDDHGRLVNWRNEGAVRSYNFRNVPTSACTDPNHPWWNH